MGLFPSFQLGTYRHYSFLITHYYLFAHPYGVSSSQNTTLMIQALKYSNRNNYTFRALTHWYVSIKKFQNVGLNIFRYFMPDLQSVFKVKSVSANSLRAMRPEKLVDKKSR